MIEYAILIVMVVFAIGFGWLWVIEQRKRQKRKRCRKRGSSDSPHAESKGVVRPANDWLDTAIEQVALDRKGTPRQSRLKQSKHHER
jgi:hypothetical protein